MGRAVKFGLSAGAAGVAAARPVLAAALRPRGRSRCVTNPTVYRPRTPWGISMTRFLDTLRIQRWDDHRYYHHSLVNQSLHLLSAATFLCAYVLMFKDPALAALIGWLVAM